MAPVLLLEVFTERNIYNLSSTSKQEIITWSIQAIASKMPAIKEDLDDWIREFFHIDRQVRGIKELKQLSCRRRICKEIF